MCHLFGRSIVSRSSKKQNSLDFSTVKVEYIVTSAYYAQILYMKQTLLDYSVVLEKIPLWCDNESIVKLASNLYDTLTSSTLTYAITSL